MRKYIKIKKKKKKRKKFKKAKNEKPTDPTDPTGEAIAMKNPNVKELKQCPENPWRLREKNQTPEM